MSRGALLIIAVLVALLALAVVFAVMAWNTGDAPLNISTHGFIALGLGALGTILIGGGLMALVFFSNRSGHDAAVHQETMRRLPDDDGRV